MLIKRWHHISTDARLLLLMALINLFLMFCCGLSLLALYRAPDQITVYLPPDLNNGALMLKDHIPKPYIATFAFNIWQLINDWPHDGEIDYQTNLNRYQAYLTPSFYQELTHQYQELQGRGEISHRVRQISPFLGHFGSTESVEQLSERAWLVHVTVELREFVNGVMVKNKNILFKIRVGRSDTNRQLNPFGLVLEGFVGSPVIVDSESSGGLS